MSWWKTAKVGDWVVLAREFKDHSDRGSPCPIRVGDKRKILEIGDLGHANYVFIRTQDVASDGGECWFNIKHFRPVQTKSTDTGMTILKSILNGAPVREDA